MSESRAGRCYELALAAMADMADRGATLVHGYPTLTAGPHKGQRYGHAWLEWSQAIPAPPAEVLAAHPEMAQLVGFRVATCWDPITQGELPQALYYMAGQIDPDLCCRYTLAEALDQLLVCGTWGPWTDPPAGTMFADD